jgi:hypothetical protein
MHAFPAGHETSNRAIDLMNRFLPIFLGLLLSNAAFAGPTRPSVIKIVSRFISPQIPPDSFAAKPKAVYIAGDSYARVEEEPDAARGIHGLIIISEPDSWMINLLDHSGRHMVDPGPTFIIHHNILGRESSQRVCIARIREGDHVYADSQSGLAYLA